MRRVGGYTLSTRLASGNLGAVYLARNPQDAVGSERAIKLIRQELLSDLRFARLLMAEGPSVEAFRHPAVVEVTRIERVNDDAFVVMELLAGQPFGVVAQRARIDNEPLSHRMVAWIGARLGSALAQAHETPWFSGAPAPMVHGAVAPRSLFVTYSGQVRLLGLGLGRARHVIAPSLSRLPYLAPEVLQGRDLTARADIYGLALVLYEAFTGRTMFRRGSADATRAAVLQANVPRLNARNLDINPDIGDLLADMMAPRPAARPASLMDAVAAFKSAADGEDASFEKTLAAFMNSRFREEQEAFQRQLAVSLRQPSSGVVSGEGPVAVDSGPLRPDAPKVSVLLPGQNGHQAQDASAKSTPAAPAGPPLAASSRPVSAQVSERTSRVTQLTDAPTVEIPGGGDPVPPSSPTMPVKAVNPLSAAESAAAATSAIPDASVLAAMPDLSMLAEGAGAATVPSQAPSPLPPESKPNALEPPTWPEAEHDPVDQTNLDIDPVPEIDDDALDALPGVDPDSDEAGAFDLDITVSDGGLLPFEEDASPPDDAAAKAFGSAIPVDLGRNAPTTDPIALTDDQRTVADETASVDVGASAVGAAPASSERGKPARPMSSWGVAPLTGSLDDTLSPSAVPLTERIKKPAVSAVPERARLSVVPGAEGASEKARDSRTPGEWSADVALADGPATVEEPTPASLQSELGRTPAGLPERVSRYHVRSAFAQVRGMWVLSGWDPNLSRPVRIHLLDPHRGWDPHQEPEQRVARFKVAARRWSGLRHPALPTLLDGGRDGPLYFLVFEAPTGTLLTELLADPEALAMPRIRSLLSDVTEGLLHLHDQGLVLGHVRAASIVVGPERARFVDMTHMGESGESGAPPRPLLVQAPENLAGAPYDHRSEQFALGALLYQLLVGQRPFGGVDDQALAAAIRHRGLNSPKDHNPNVDGTLSHCCMRMLSPSPQGRYPSLREVLNALKTPRIPAQDTEPDAPVSAEPASRSRSVVIIEPSLPSETTEALLRKGGVSAAAFRTWAEAERHLEGLHPNLLVISSASGVVTPPERSNAEWRVVPPASSRLLGPPLATDGLIERLASLAGRALGVGPASSGPPEGWPSRLARQVCLRLGLGHDTAMRVSVAMAFRQMQHRLRLSANDVSDLVPVEARRLFRFRPQPGLPGPPAAQTLWAVEMFFNEMMPAAGGSRRPAKVLQMIRGHVGTELDNGVMEALVAQLRELYPELDLPAVAQKVPRVMLAGLSDRPELVDALEREGFDVDTADDGHEVWSLLRAKPYRAVAVHADIEGRDGMSLLKLTRNHPETRSVSFLLLADESSPRLQQSVQAAAPAELITLDTPLEALRVRIVRMMKDGSG